MGVGARMNRKKNIPLLTQICFQCHSLICLDFSVNNLYFIVFEVEKKLSYPKVVEVMWEEVGLEVGEDLEVQVDFDYNNHLIVDCSHQCNRSIDHNHHICNLVNYRVIQKKTQVIKCRNLFFP